MTEQAMQRILDMLQSETMRHPDQGPKLALAYIQGRLLEASDRAEEQSRRRHKGQLTLPLKKAILLSALTAMVDEIDETIRGLQHDAGRTEGDSGRAGSSGGAELPGGSSPPG